jgi:hypothetical protein
MMLGSAAIAPPKPDVIAPKPAPLAKPPPPPQAVPQQFKTASPAAKANPVNLTGEAKPAADIKAKSRTGNNPAGNVPPGVGQHVWAEHPHGDGGVGRPGPGSSPG